MMPHTRRLRRRLLALVSCALLAGVLTLGVSAAGAAGNIYGELRHFGASGAAKGQFNLTESQQTTEAFGVDPSTNAVYVGDGPTKKEYRIQKFELKGSKWEQVAEVKFKPPHTGGLEGIAVDAVEKRVYVLTLDTRAEEEKQAIDPEKTAASTLYAFTTEKLEAAPGTTLGVLVPAGTLGPLSDTPGKSLLEPRGIAVDPLTHEVVVMASEDPTGNGEEELRTVIQRVSSAGKLEPRWVDETGFFENPQEATSPVFSAAGKLDVLGGTLTNSESNLVEEIDEVPFTEKAPPKPVVQFNRGSELVSFPGNPVPSGGAGLSIGPEDGALWTSADVNDDESAKRHLDQGALKFTAAGVEQGWTGGQTKALGSEQCTISFEGPALVAAGKEGHVFIFDTSAAEPKVVEFGSGGTGCPEATATPPTATVSGGPPLNSVLAGQAVTLSSTVKQADALSSKWEFTHGAETEVSEENNDQFQTTSLEHVFRHNGEFTIKEVIKTDDLATPTITLERTLKVEPTPPKVQLNESSQSPSVGETVTFTGRATDPNGALPLKYAWRFGDGTETTTETSTESSSTSHVYQAPGGHTVELTVTDTLGLKSTVTTSVTAIIPTPPPTTTTNTGTSPAPPPSELPGGSGKTGVLSYQASLAGTSLAVTTSGSLVVKVDCLGQSSCTGTVTLRTVSAVSASSHKKRKAVLTLASGSFSVAGGHVKAVTLHLSSKARALLARSHVLRARATIVGRDSAGAAHTTQALVTLRAPKGHGKH